MLRLERVSKTYPDGTKALSGVSLHVPRGQFCVVLGASGAGKSTMLGLFNGLSEPTEGAVLFDGTPVDRSTLAAVRPRVGTIHQAFRLVPRLSVLQNVLTGLLPKVGAVRGLLGWFRLAQRRRACALLHEVGLEEPHLYRRAAQLSGGQQQRVGIARAMIGEPDLVLADEPVASLDPQVSREVLGLLRRLCGQRGTTVLCSLHQVELATAFADRVVGMRAGRVVFDAPPAALDAAALAAVYTGDEGAGAEENVPWRASG